MGLSYFFADILMSQLLPTFCPMEITLMVTPRLERYDINRESVGYYQ